MDGPLKPNWVVVHRDVLVELLDMAGAWVESSGELDLGRYDQIERIKQGAVVGILPVLTKERWEEQE